MKATLAPLEGNKVKLSVEVDEAEFEEAIDAAFKRIAQEVRIPGFRPGKAPRRILEARIGTEYAREQALRDALPQYYARAVRENDVDVIAPPEIDITAGREEGAVAFEAVVEVRPEVMVPGYAGLRVEIPNPVPTEEEIDAQVDRLRRQHGELVDADRPAIDGDQVTIDITGSQNGEPIEGLTAQDYLYEVGSGTVTEALDEQLRGATPGSILEFSAPMPGSDGDIDFRVLVKQVKQVVLPEATDEWAAEASEFSTLAELRADLASRMQQVRIMQAQVLLRDRITSALAELVDEDPPEALVDMEMRSRLQDLALRLQAQGLTLEQYLEYTGQEPSALTDELRAQAVQAVKADLGLRAVATAEQIEVTDEELEAEYARLAVRFQQKASEVRKQIERNDGVPELRSDLRKRKALEWLVEHVEIVDPEGQPIDRSVLTLAGDAADGDESDASGDSTVDTSVPSESSSE